METYDVKLTNTAVADLDEIYAYVASVLQEPATALRLIETLEAGISSLRELPERCPTRKIGQFAEQGYRQLFVKNFTVVYRVDTQKKQVIILTVRYSKSLF